MTLLFLYNAVLLKEDTEASDSDEDVGVPEEPHLEPAVFSSALDHPTGLCGIILLT